MRESIKAVDLKKVFRPKGKIKPIEAVRGVTLSVEYGEIFGFLGPNGAGKTTCQRMLTTLLPIDDGTATIAGFDVRKKPHEVRKRIGYVSQLGGADLPATGRENLRLTGRLYGMKPKDVERKIDDLSRLLDIEELLDRIVRTYSGGQRRRLEIALGIIHEPEILFMDEPTTGLDPQNRASLWEHIRKLKEQGMTLFLTTHYLDEADALSDRLAIIDKGKIVAEGTPAQLKRQISGDVITLKLKTEADAEKVMTAIHEKDLLNEIKRNTDTVVLYAKDGAKTMPVLFEMLKAEWVDAESISLSTPSLNDVFLKQTGRGLRDAGKEEA